MRRTESVGAGLGRRGITERTRQGMTSTERVEETMLGGGTKIATISDGETEAGMNSAATTCGAMRTTTGGVESLRGMTTGETEGRETIHATLVSRRGRIATKTLTGLGMRRRMTMTRDGKCTGEKKGVTMVEGVTRYPQAMRWEGPQA